MGSVVGDSELPGARRTNLASHAAVLCLQQRHPPRGAGGFELWLGKCWLSVSALLLAPVSVVCFSGRF